MSLAQRINADVLTLLAPEEIKLLTDNIGDKLRLVRGIRQLLDASENNHVSTYPISRYIIFVGLILGFATFKKI